MIRLSRIVTPLIITVMYKWLVLSKKVNPLRDEIHNLRNFYEPFMNIHDMFMTGS